MEQKYTLASLLCAGLAISLAVAASVNVSKGLDKTDLGDKVLVCYVSSWARYRPGNGSFLIDDVDPKLCTHLVYAFAGLNATSFTLRSLDPFNDLEEDYGRGSYKRLSAFRDKNPLVKVTLAVGGWNEGSANYSLMASTAASRQRFVASAVDFVRRFNFDGLDLDWEFPAKRDGKPEDKDNFLSLVKELRAAFAPHGWLLTAALGAGPDTIEAAYHVAELSRYLDFLHAMCYDYHGAWDKETKANTPLRKQDDKFSVEDSIELLLSLGADPNKLVMGLAVYGRTFLTTAPATSALGARAAAAGFQGPYTREDGFLGYNEICLELNKRDAEGNSDWTQLWDADTDTPFAVNGKKVISYDNAISIGKKVEFAMSKRLAGLMVWALDNDDFRNDCATGHYPLLHAIRKAVASARHSHVKPVVGGASVTSPAIAWIVLAALGLAARAR